VQSSNEEQEINISARRTGLSSDEDTRPNPKSKWLRINCGSGKGEHEERCQLSVAASLTCEESLTPFAAKNAPGLQDH
jgi:hypothetical protein